MKRIIICIFFFVGIGVSVFFSSCYKDKEELLYPSNNTADCSNPAVQKGVKFTAVQSVIQSSCVSCHNNGGTSPNLTNACNIVDSWSRINTRCVIQQNMPPSAPLSVSNQQAITDWINAGHLYTN